MTGDQFLFSLQADANVVAREVPSERILELRVHAPQSQLQQARMKLNLGLVLDRSGSMHGEKLDYAKQAAGYVLDLLQNQDRAALVAFDDNVDVLSTSVPINEENRQILRGKIRELMTGSSTNLSGGWLQGCQEIAVTAEEGQLVRTLLLTDGLANVGIIDLEQLGYHSRQLYNRGVSTSTFGVGTDYNEHLLEEMANMGGGKYYFIDHPRRIPEIFAEELNELGSITARRIEVILTLPEQVDAKVIGGWRNDLQEGSLHIYLGDLPANQVREVYVKILVPPQNEKEGFEIQGIARALGENGEAFEERVSLVFGYDSRAAEKAAPRRIDLLGRFGSVIVAEAANQALKLEREGKRDEAGKLLDMTVDINSPFLVAEQLVKYRSMAKRMRRGMDEFDLKASHAMSYNDRQRRTKDQK
jgi:Ca-activated chloride channel family protein